MEQAAFQRGGTVGRDELDQLFIAAWGASKPSDGMLQRSFTTITCRDEGRLIGFVNVAWDGGLHFFLLDTTVHPDWRGTGIARRMVLEAIEACRGKGDWLHVDASGELMARLYLPCGFQPTPAGLVDLSSSAGG